MVDVINSNTLGSLGFENDFLSFIERDLRIHVHFAQQYQQRADVPDIEQRQTYLGLAATHYRRAMAHTLLIETRSRELVEKVRLFESTVSIYQQLNMPYALLLSSFLPQEFSQRSINYPWDNTLDANATTVQENRRIQYIYLLLFRAAQNGEIYKDLRQEMETYRSQPIGVLGLPVGVYLDLIDALTRPQSRLELNIEQALAPFITSYDQAIRRATRNKYLWKQLAQPFHPAEPDIFGLLLLIRRRVEHEFEINIRGFSERLFIAKQTQTLITGILNNF